MRRNYYLMHNFLQIVFPRQQVKLASPLKDDWSVRLLKMMINDGVLHSGGSISDQKSDKPSF